MHRQQEHKLVVLVLASLYLLKHRLRFLQQDQSLLKTFLRNEVDGTLVELVYHHWHLVYPIQIEFKNTTYLHPSPGLCCSISRKSLDALCHLCLPCRHQPHQCRSQRPVSISCLSCLAACWYHYFLRTLSNCLHP